MVGAFYVLSFQRWWRYEVSPSFYWTLFNTSESMHLVQTYIFTFYKKPTNIDLSGLPKGMFTSPLILVLKYPLLWWYSLSWLQWNRIFWLEVDGFCSVHVLIKRRSRGGKNGNVEKDDVDSVSAESPSSVVRQEQLNVETYKNSKGKNTHTKTFK